MSLQSIVQNEMIQDEFQVWRFKKHTQFAYSDGASSEGYLRKVFSKVKNLSFQSTELENYIKDWTSEYHLSKKRAQLLSGFSFDRSSKVLEVGCGCGAITRFLGENFDQVVAIEGNINRARVAKQRTKEFDGVSVLCAPFQEINFSQKFDIIFFEYSASFIKGEDPYDAALQYFSSILSPGGRVVIAIENQFGLKYFNGAREDHLGLRFEGLEGYHRKPGKVRTFGRVELESRLRKYFSDVQFYYPFPDYKLPDCVISEEFLASGRAGELIAQMSSRDYGGPKRFLWDEAAVTLELDRNRMLGFFSNSFLVVASFSGTSKKVFNQEAIFYSDGRKPEYSTQTRIVKERTGELRVIKQPKVNPDDQEQRPLKMVKTESFWIDAQSLQTQVSLRARAQNCSLDEIFAPCKRWREFLATKSNMQDDIPWLDGKYIDVIWSNTYFVGSECRFVDQEWVWHEKIRLNVIVIRIIYDFLSRIDKNGLQGGALSTRCGKTLIKEIAEALGIRLFDEDFTAFIDLEGQIAEIVTTKTKFHYTFYLRWFLFDRPTLRFARWAYTILSSLKSNIFPRLINVFTKSGFILVLIFWSLISSPFHFSLAIFSKSVIFRAL